MDAFVPHHLDQDWAIPQATSTTCLDEPGGPLKALGGDGPPRRRAEVPGHEAAAWPALDDSTDVLAELNADPGLQSLGLSLASAGTKEGDNRRQARRADAQLEKVSLRQLAARLTNWELTFVACGGGGPTRATFRCAGDSPAVLSVSLGSSGSSGSQPDVAVTAPIVGAPETTWLDTAGRLSSTPCLTSPPKEITVSGTPAVLPTELTPLAH